MYTVIKKQEYEKDEILKTFDTKEEAEEYKDYYERLHFDYILDRDSCYDRTEVFVVQEKKPTDKNIYKPKFVNSIMNVSIKLSERINDEPFLIIEINIDKTRDSEDMVDTEKVFENDGKFACCSFVRYSKNMNFIDYCRLAREEFFKNVTKIFCGMNDNLEDFGLVKLACINSGTIMCIERETNLFYEKYLDNVKDIDNRIKLKLLDCYNEANTRFGSESYEL